MDSRKESLKARLQREWQALIAQKEARTVEGDVSRAEVLARYVEEGLTQQEIAEGLELKLTYICYLLRFHRFNSQYVNQKISEGRFRQYWQQVRDPRAVVGRRNPETKAAYEQLVFAAIAEMIEAGKPPLKPVKVVQPKTAEQLRASVDWAKATKKEVQRIYQTELRPTLKRLQGMLHADRATFTPALQANAAFAVEHAAPALARAVHGPGEREELLNQTQCFEHYDR